MKGRQWVGGIVFCVLGCVALVLASSAQDKIAKVSEESYADFMANEALDVQDLAEGAEIQREYFNLITPPGVSWIQPMFPPVAPFVSTNFAVDFLDGLLGEDKNSVAIYPLSLVLDPKTRETLLYNAEGKLIATIPADGKSRTWSEDADPARVTLQLDLLPSEDVEPYLYTESRVDESIASASTKSKTPKPGGFAMKSLETNEFGFANIQKLTNGNMQLTVTNGADVAEVFSYTVLHTSTVVVITWTNEESNVVTDTNTLWTPISPMFNGLESAWTNRTTNLALANGVGVWEDANISSNDRIRFYGLANRADFDEDGLTDGAEKFVYHTNPSLADTDEDDLGDGDEVNGYGTDPLVLDTDGDGLSDGEEIIDIGTDPLLADTDRDGMPDGWEMENDFNAMSGITGPLVAWYLFDEGAGVAISNTVSSSYTGVLFNASTTNWIRGYTGGSNDYALWFDGSDDYVAIPTNQSGSVVTQAPFSVSAWVFQDAGMNKRWGTVFSDSGWNSTNGYITGYSLRVDTNYNSACYYVGCSTNYDGCYQAAWKTLYVGRWVHIVGTYTGTTMKLYVDGVLAQSKSAVFAPQSNPQLWIGRGHVNAGESHWQGAIDDVRFYNWAMGTQEVAALCETYADEDSDGLSNLAEFQAETEPRVADTDNDGLTDGNEVNVFFTNPLVADPWPEIVILWPQDGQEI